MTDLERWYRILELEPGASLDEVKQAYRDLARIWHPDRFGGDPRLRQRAEERQKEINEAFQQLEAHADQLGRLPARRVGPAPPPQPQTFQPPPSRKKDPAKDTWTIRPALGLQDLQSAPRRRTSYVRHWPLALGLLLVVLVLGWLVLR